MTLNNLAKFIAYLVHNVPYYMKYDENITLEDLPIVTKQIIKNDYESFITKKMPDEDREKVLHILSGDFNKRTIA